MALGCFQRRGGRDLMKKGYILLVHCAIIWNLFGRGLNERLVVEILLPLSSISSHILTFIYSCNNFPSLRRCVLEASMYRTRT